ncbi:uncharacterized protein LOC115440288 isoform X1 [Manduca sexta]|uniref:uncharacterized protein LOC115440288 isoform X1 n=1 Tax=Manduca sexta TaxID=7130 RepID=UPI00188DE789|nr:uncharacterized protein LOC115440288 isoform X1 [Manduca sexta]
MSEMEENLEKLTNLDDILNSDDPSKLPSTKEILEMLETADMPDEMKENLRAMLTGHVPQVFGTYESRLAILFVVLMIGVIFFFGYKLYKSIKEKEIKREEKKKLKQMKKKK